MVERLKRELTQDPKRLIVLWGVGGVGKTTIAAETARELEGVLRRAHRLGQRGEARRLHIPHASERNRHAGWAKLI